MPITWFPLCVISHFQSFLGSCDGIQLVFQIPLSVNLSKAESEETLKQSRKSDSLVHSHIKPYSDPFYPVCSERLLNLKLVALRECRLSAFSEKRTVTSTMPSQEVAQHNPRVRETGAMHELWDAKIPTARTTALAVELERYRVRVSAFTYQSTKGKSPSLHYACLAPAELDLCLPCYGNKGNLFADGQARSVGPTWQTSTLYQPKTLKNRPTSLKIDSCFAKTKSWF